MATETTELIYNVTGQELAIDCPEGRPSGDGTIKVVKAGYSADADAEFEGTASLESQTTSINGASGYSQSDRTEINVDDATGFEVGRVYLIDNATGQREWIEVASVDTSADKVYSVFDLQNDYETGDTLESTRLTFSVPSSFLQDIDKLSSDNDGHPGYRVIWDYTVDSSSVKRLSFFNLVRAPGGHNVRLTDLFPYFPDLEHKLSRPQRGRAENLIDEAYNRLRLDLKGIGQNATQIRDQWVVDELVKLRALYNFAMAGYNPTGDFTSGEFVNLRRNDYFDAFNAHLALTDKTARAVTDSGAATTEPHNASVFVR